MDALYYSCLSTWTFDALDRLSLIAHTAFASISFCFNSRGTYWCIVPHPQDVSGSRLVSFISGQNWTLRQRAAGFRSTKRTLGLNRKTNVIMPSLQLGYEKHGQPQTILDFTILSSLRGRGGGFYGLGEVPIFEAKSHDT